MTKEISEQAKSARDLLALIARINKASTKLQTMIHDAAMGCLRHAVAFGDAVPMQKLYLALPKSQRREALLDWVHDNSPIRIRQEGQKVGIVSEGAKDYRPFDIDNANATPFWEKNERALKPMGNINPETLIQQAIDRLQKRMDEEAADKASETPSNVVYFKEGVDPVEEMAGLKAALAAIQSAKPKRRVAA